MEEKKWYWYPVVMGLCLGIAFAQAQNSQDNPRQPARDHAASVTRQTAMNVSANTGTDSLGQPSTPNAGAQISQHDSTPTPFVEDFPKSDSGDGIPELRSPLPVILDSRSPRRDRQIDRRDIAPVPGDYVIGEEDVLTVTVWKERDLSGTVVVRPDGKITVPLVGEVKVVGMKPVQLETLLQTKLKPFITVPQVSVAVNQINSRKIYMIGEVVREGTFPINSSMTVLQVLAAAGGLRDFAKRKKIYILRKRGDEEIRFPFDYDAAIRGRNREQNIQVVPGDTIVVP
jgi:polysaccharide export outer membrane protein